MAGFLRPTRFSLFSKSQHTKMAVRVASLLSIFLSFAFSASAQFFVYSEVPVATSPLNVCDGPRTFSVTLVGSASASSGIGMTLTMPIGMRYVTGSATYKTKYSGSVTEASTALTYQPKFTLNNVGVGDSVRIEFQAEADCRRINQPVNKNTFDFTYNTNQTKQHISVGYNVQYAALTIATVTPAFFTAAVGTNFTRKIYVKNGGAGTLSQFAFQDEMGPGMELVSISSNATINGVPTVDPGTGRKLYKITVNNFTTAVNSNPVNTNNNNKFEFNEIVEIIETLKVKDCGTTDLTSKLKASYGCFGDECTTGTATREVGGEIDQNVNPKLDYRIIEGTEYCRANAKKHKIVVKNTGNAIAKNVVLFVGEDGGSPSTLTSDINGGGLIGKVLYYNNFRVARNNAALAPLTFSQVRSPNAVGVCFPSAYPSGSVSIGKFSTADMNPGDSVIIEFDEIRCTNTEYCIAGEYYKYSIYSNYENACVEFKATGASNAFRPQYTQTQLKTEPTAPTYINHGETKRFCFRGNQNPWNSAADHNPATAYIEYRLKLPKGVTLQNPNTDFKFLDKNGLLYPLNTVTALTDSTYTIRFKKTDIPANADFADYNLCADAFYKTTKTSCGEGEITIEAYMNLDPTCGANNLVKIRCKLNAQLMRDCGIVDGCDGMVNRELKAYRTQFGVVDVAKDVRPDWFMQGDTMHVEYRGHVSNPVNRTWKNAYTEFQIPNGNDFDVQAIKARVRIYSKAAAQWFTCTNPTITTITGASFTSRIVKVDYSVSALASCLPSTFKYDTGDSVEVYADLHIKKNLENSVFENSAFYAQSYTSDIANPTNPTNQFYCGVIRGKYTYVGWNEAGDKADVASDGCDFTLSCFRSSPLTTNNTNFPGERRQFRVPKSLVYNIPTGWEFSRMTIRNTASNDSVTIVGQVQGNKFVATNLKQYFKPYGGTLDLAAENDYFQYCVVMRGSCSTPQTQTYKWGKVEYEMLSPVGTVVTTPFFTGQDPNKNDSGTANVYLADFLITTIPPQDTVFISKTNVATWDIKITNQQPRADGIFSWIAKNTTKSGVKIIKVDSLGCFGGGTFGPTVTSDPNGIYRIGKIGRNDSKCFRITGEFASCIKDSIEIVAGWNCSGYPPSVNDAKFDCSSLKKKKLFAVPTPTQVQLRIDRQPVPNVKLDLCQFWEYEVRIINAKEGSIKDLKLHFNIDPDTDVEILPNTSFVKYPSATASFVTAPDPVKEGGEFIWDICKIPAIVTALGSNGLPGTLSNNLNEISFKFRAKSVACGYKSGSSFVFQAEAYDFCGMRMPATDQATNPVFINGLPPGSNTYLVDIQNAADIQTCTDFNAPMAVSIINNGPSASKSDETIDLVFPTGVSVANITNQSTAVLGVPQIINQNGGTVYRYRMPNGVAIGGEIKFTANLRGTANLDCDLNRVKLKVTTNKEFQATCIEAPNTVCTISEITGQDTIRVNVKRPSLEITSFVATAKLNPPTGERVKATITLKNISNYTISAGDTILVKIYQDTDQNTVFSAGDTFLGDSLVAVFIGAGSSASVTFTLNVPAGKTCPLIAVVDGRGCVCSKGQAYQPNVPLEPLPDVTACSSFDIQLGIPGVTGYTYRWFADSPANGLDYLKSFSIPQPIFNKVNTSTTTPEIIKYRVGVNRGICVEYFTLTVRLNPTGFGPQAGKDTALCSPATDLQLKFSGTWSAVAGNPSNATINSAGLITNMTANGNYKFVISLPSCGTDTVVVTRKAKPNAGIDKFICSPATTAILVPAGAGETWTSPATNPPTVTITPSGSVSNLNNTGTYKFILKDIAGCFDEAQVIKTNRPNAGTDVTICGTDVGYKLPNAIGGTWEVVATGNPSAATINATTGLIAGMANLGTYKFILNGGGGCADTVAVIKLQAPDFTLTSVQATCLGGAVQDNGQLVVSTFVATDKSDFSVGTTYNGTKNYSSASPIAITGILANNLVNPSVEQAYTVRIFNVNGCFTDKTIILQSKTCECKAVICSPFPVYKKIVNR
jgi:hypothetical protein